MKRKWPPNLRSHHLSGSLNIKARSNAQPAMNPIARNLLRGAFLRVASDLTGGTPLENIKTRVATTTLSPVKAARDIVKGNNGILNLWSGTPSRIIEGAMLGAVFMVGSTAAKKQVLGMGGSKTVAALAGEEKLIKSDI